MCEKIYYMFDGDVAASFSVKGNFSLLDLCDRKASHINVSHLFFTCFGN